MRAKLGNMKQIELKIKYPPNLQKYYCFHDIYELRAQLQEDMFHFGTNKSFYNLTGGPTSKKKKHSVYGICTFSGCEANFKYSVKNDALTLQYFISDHIHTYPDTFPEKNRQFARFIQCLPREMSNKEKWVASFQYGTQKLWSFLRF